MRSLLMTLVLVLTTAHAALGGRLVVSAAASLTDAFTDMEPAFEAAHPGVDVVMNFAASGALYRQIEQGAPADVFASANPKWMQRAVEGGFAAADSVVVFAANTLVLAAPKGNPAGVTGLASLTDPAVGLVALGTPETVPAGQYAKSALTAAGLFETLTPKYIFAENVRQVLDYVARGEVDCGFMYRTDAVKRAGAVVVVADIPLATPVAYPMAPLAGSAAPELARAFVAFAASAEGQALLRARGFASPPAGD